MLIKRATGGGRRRGEHMRGGCKRASACLRGTLQETLCRRARKALSGGRGRGEGGLSGLDDALVGCRGFVVVNCQRPTQGRAAAGRHERAGAVEAGLGSCGPDDSAAVVADELAVELSTPAGDRLPHREANRHRPG